MISSGLSVGLWFAFAKRDENGDASQHNARVQVLKKLRRSLVILAMFLHAGFNFWHWAFTHMQLDQF